MEYQEHLGALESVRNKDVVLVAWEPWNRAREHVDDQWSMGLSSS